MRDDVPGWRKVLLGDAVTLFNGKAGGTGGTWLRAFKTRHVYDGYVRTTDPSFVPDERATAISKDTYLRSGDTLTPNMAHGTIGRVAFVRDAGDNWTVDGQIMVLRPKEGVSVGRYVFDWMSRPESKRFLVALERGGAFDELRGQTHIYRDDVARLPILLPPVHEQAKISAILAAVDDAIEATKTIIDQLQVVRKAMMAELLTRGLPGRHTRFKRTSIGEIPESWQIVNLGSVSVIGNGSTPSKQRADYWDGGSVPWLPTGKVNDRVIEAADAFVTAKALAECPIRLLPEGTLLVAMVGQGKTRGKVAYLAIEAAINQNFAYIIPDDSLLPWFLFAYLENNYERLRADGRGSNQEALNCGLIKQWIMPLPALEEQAGVSNSLLMLDARIDGELNALTGLANLKAALSAVLLTGEIRVTPDTAIA